MLSQLNEMVQYEIGSLTHVNDVRLGKGNDSYLSPINRAEVCSQVSQDKAR